MLRSQRRSRMQRLKENVSGVITREGERDITPIRKKSPKRRAINSEDEDKDIEEMDIDEQAYGK
jgi:hypothetical protein